MPGKSKRRGKNPLSRPIVGRHGDQLLVRVSSARAGRLGITARKGGRRLGGCRVRASAGRVVLCRISLAKAARAALYCPVPRTSRLGMRKVRITVTLRVHRRLVAVRRRQF